jgi:hypothetical protein
MDEGPSDAGAPGTSGVEASVSGTPAPDVPAGPGVAERGKEQARRQGSMARDQALRRADKRKGTLASAFAITVGETGRGQEASAVLTERTRREGPREGRGPCERHWGLQLRPCSRPGSRAAIR